MQTILVVDDEQRGRELLSLLIKRILPNVNIKEAASVDSAVNIYLEEKPNFVFLDVEMPKRNGFEFIKDLVQNGLTPKVVFVTAYNQYAIEAIKNSALDYLLKPVNEEDLRMCINRINLKWQESNENEKILELLTRMKLNHRLKINTRNGFEVINPENILYCEADGNYTTICLTAGARLITPTTLGIVEYELPKGEFYRVSRSAIINLSYLKSVNRKARICRLQVGSITYDIALSLARIQELSNLFNS